MGCALRMVTVWTRCAEPDHAIGPAQRHAGLVSAVAAHGCTGGKMERDDDDREFEVYSASCSDGRAYDLKFNADYTFKSKKFDD